MKIDCLNIFSGLIGLRKELDGVQDGFHPAVLQQAVCNVHAAKTTAGSDGSGAGGSDIFNFPVIYLAGDIIMSQAEGAAGAATAGRFLHFNQF